MSARGTHLKSKIGSISPSYVPSRPVGDLAVVRFRSNLTSEQRTTLQMAFAEQNPPFVKYSEIGLTQIEIHFDVRSKELYACRIDNLIDDFLDFIDETFSRSAKSGEQHAAPKVSNGPEYVHNGHRFALAAHLR
jgi:hypothetical protein